MSLTADELNYLIWRYFQESGLEVSALAVQDETTVARFDDQFKGAVPIGALVNMVQRGILYSEVDRLVAPNGDMLSPEQYQEKFTLFHALGADAVLNGTIDPSRNLRFSDTSSSLSELPSSGENKDKSMNGDSSTAQDREATPEAFITTLKEETSFGPTITSKWSPTSDDTVALGMTGARAKVRSPTLDSHLAHSQYTDFDITVVEWSPNGKVLVTAIETGELRLWSPEGRLRNVMSLHQKAVVMARWSPKGDYLLTTDTDNVSILWDSSSGNVVQRLDQLSQADNTHVLGIDATWIDDTKFVVPGLAGSALVFSTRDRTPIGTLSGHQKALAVIDYSKDYNMLLTASDDRTLRVWEGSVNKQIMIGHSQPVTFAGWVNKDIVISCGLDATIRLWSVTSGRVLGMVVTDGIPILIGALNGDKSRLAVGLTDGLVSLYQLNLFSTKPLVCVGQYQPEVGPEDEETNTITSLSWNHSGTKLIAGYSHCKTVVLESV